MATQRKQIEFGRNKLEEGFWSEDDYAEFLKEIDCPADECGWGR